MVDSKDRDIAREIIIKDDIVENDDTNQTKENITFVRLHKNEW